MVCHTHHLRKFGILILEFYVKIMVNIDVDPV